MNNLKKTMPAGSPARVHHSLKAFSQPIQIMELGIQQAEKNLRILRSIRDQRTQKQGNKGTAKKLWNKGAADILVDI